MTLSGVNRKKFLVLAFLVSADSDIDLTFHNSFLYILIRSRSRDQHTTGTTMTKCTPSLFFAASVLALALLVEPAQAQSRVFVAAQGSDANPCTFALPCRTFQHAHDVVAAGGEIDVLDPAGYGSVIISKAISIQGHGFAGLAVPSGDGITINAGTSDKISLRGLLIDGVGTGGNGILFNAGGSLHVHDCLIRNFNSGNGITFQPGAASKLSVSNTQILDNAGDGVNISPSGSGSVTVVFDHVEMDNNGVRGLFVNGSGSTGIVRVTVSESVAAHAQQGIAAASTGAPVNVMVRNCTIANNSNLGLVATGTSGMAVTRSTITGNNAGLGISSTLLSYGDNNIDANNVNGTPTGMLTLH